MKAKKLLSVLLAMILAFSCMTVLTITAPLTVSAATLTEDAILIGRANDVPKAGTTKPMVNIMLPIGAKSAGSGYSNFDGEVYFKLQFKCKMLSGTQPIVGMLRTNYGSGDGTYSEHNWCYNNDVGGSGESNSSYPATMSSYDSSTGIFTAIVYAYYNETNYYRNGRWCYLTIGNAEHNNTWYSARDLGASFIMSQPTLYAYNTSTGETYGDNLAPAFNDSGCDFKGTYFLRSSGAAQYDSPYYASENKWHVDSSPALVNKIKVPTNYNTSSNYNSGNFTKHNASGTQREYYTNSNYSDLYFEKVKYSNDAGFKVISNINKQMIIIEANHNGEADNRTTDGYQPVYNRPANIFLPINFGQYSMNGAATQDGNFLIKVSMTAVRLEGDGYPVLGRIVGKKSVGSGGGSQAFGKMVKNLHLSGYYGASSHEQYTGGDFSYNESTGAFVGWIRVRRSDNDYATKWGNNEVITIGNAEHVWQEGTFDTTEFNSSFAISDVKIDVYTCTNPSSGVYAVDSLLAEDVAPGFTAENIDDTSRWAYQYTGSGSNSDYDCIRGNQYKWSAEGNVGLVHRKDLTACMKGNHVGNMTHHAATDTTREYWGCATCKKSYADPYGIEEISDTSATKQMVVIRAAGNGPASLVYPLRLTDFENNQWYKFTCKVKCYGDDAPVVTTLYGDYGGGNAYTTTNVGNDFGIQECTYNASTGTLTAYLYGWIKDTINKSNRYPFERINPISGANCALVIGNGRYVGNGYADSNFTSSYVISDPVLKKISGATSGASALDDAKSKSVTGDNLVNGITDKTIDFDSTFTATMTNGDNPMTGTIGKWYKTGSKKSMVDARDIPAGVFSGTANTRTLRASGPTNVNNVIVASYETYIDSNTTYQFDVDYSIFGGAEPRILVQTATSDGFGTDNQIYANDTVNGNHITYVFTTGELRTNSANFRIQLGVDAGSQNKQTTVYYGNAMLRKKTGNTYGPNHIINGDFSFTPTSFNGVYSTSMTDNEIAATIPYWSPGNATDGSGVGAYTIGAIKGTRKYNNVTLLPSSGYIFGSNAATGKSDVAVKMNGSASHGTQLQFFAGLEPSTTYRLVFNYRSNGDAPELSAVSTKDAAANPTVTKTNDFPRYGVFSAQYDITTGSDYTYSPNSNGNGNTRFIFKLGGFSQGKYLYISGVTLHKLSGGNPVGINIAGELNPILNDSVYNGVIPNDGDEYPVLYSQDGTANMNKFVAVGWYGYNQANDYTSVNGSVVNVPSDFFQRTSYPTRLSNLRKAIIGFKAANATDPDYNPNGDSNIADVKDLVHMKIKTLNYEGKFDGAANAAAKYMLEKVIDVKNDSSGYISGGTSYYVSTSGSDSNNGKSADAPLKTISAANNKASSGDTIYLKRGDTWRSTDLDADYAFTLKSGVHYAAYGSGEKPVLSGSAKNYASNSWYETSSGSHIWYTTYNSGSASTNTNAGMIYFYDNKGNLSYGKSIAKPKDDDRHYSFSASDLDSDLEFFAPYKTGSYTLTLSGMTGQGKIYVYSVANPTTRFSRIEIATDHRGVVRLTNGTNNTTAGITTMNNIAVMYGSIHGVKAVSGGSNTMLNKCEIAYIGGGMSHDTGDWSRLGNGVEFGDGYTNGRVYDCYVHDCFDAGLTFQSYGSNSQYKFSYMIFERNLIENCTYNIEFFTRSGSSDKMWDISFSNNVLRNAGYGWGGYDRADGGWRISNICGSKNNYMNITTEGSGANFKIQNNIFDCTRNAQVVWYWDSAEGPAKHANLTVSGNTYFQKKGNIGGVDSPRVMNYGAYSSGSSNMKYAYSRDAFINAVAAFDDNPMGVYWLDDNY